MTKNVVKHSLVQFTMVGNICLRNQNISNGAKGLYATLWDLPDDWELTYQGLAAKCKDGISAIKTQMHELLAEGYVVVEQQRGENGRMGVNVWNVLNIPAAEADRTPVKTRKKKSPLTEKPLTDFPLTEKPLAVNRTQDNKENNIIREEEGNRQAVSSHTHTKADFSDLEERQVRWFADTWNKKRNEHPESHTARITSLGKKRRNLILAIFKEYDREGIVRHDLIERGIRHAMTSRRAQGLNKGMIAPADINYMLEHFTELVEGTF